MYINDQLFDTQHYVDRKMRPEQMELVQQYLMVVQQNILSIIMLKNIKFSFGIILATPEIY